MKLYYCISTVVQFVRGDECSLSWKLDKNRPICPQIEEQICVKIANGELKSGEKLMSVRDVAVEASVNPNTAQKAFEGLEAKGLLTSVRGSGWYVSEQTEKAAEIVKEIILSRTREYVNSMKDLGLTVNQITDLIEKGEII